MRSYPTSFHDLVICCCCRRRHRPCHAPSSLWAGQQSGRKLRPARTREFPSVGCSLSVTTEQQKKIAKQTRKEERRALRDAKREVELFLCLRSGVWREHRKRVSTRYQSKRMKRGTKIINYSLYYFLNICNIYLYIMLNYLRFAYLLSRVYVFVQFCVNVCVNVCECMYVCECMCECMRELYVCVCAGVRAGRYSNTVASKNGCWSRPPFKTAENRCDKTKPWKC